jgi:hypothetical protein
MLRGKIAESCARQLAGPKAAILPSVHGPYCDAQLVRKLFLRHLEFTTHGTYKLTHSIEHVVHPPVLSAALGCMSFTSGMSKSDAIVPSLSHETSRDSRSVTGVATREKGGF